MANFDNQNTTRRGIVISRGDPLNFPNNANQVTRINLMNNPPTTNRLNTDKQTTAIAFVPQRFTDQANQQFFLRVKVKTDDSTSLLLKKYDHGSVP